MPNWCFNGVTLRHKDPAMIDRVIRGQENLLMEFLPTPQELVDTVAGLMGEDKRAAHEAQQRANIEKYGHKDWYDWNIANWGTKWDVSLDNVNREDANTVSAAFESAWSPPIEAYRALEDLGFEIEAYYNEPGMAFFGSYIDGCEDTIDYGSMDAETIRREFPELDERFGVSQWLEDSQAEQEQEQE